MEHLHRRLEARYLNRLDDFSWYDDEPALDFGSQALDVFIEALRTEGDGARRARLVSIIWRFRDPATLPILASTLADPGPEVWKQALDGIVAIGGVKAMEALKAAERFVRALPDVDVKVSWIAEAAAQVRDELDALPSSQ